MSLWVLIIVHVLWIFRLCFGSLILQMRYDDDNGLLSFRHLLEHVDFDWITCGPMLFI